MEGGAFRTADGEASRSGWAEKRGRLNKSWKRRFFVEEGGKLEYFAGVGSDGGANRKGELVLAGAQVSVDGERELTVQAGSRSLSLRFESHAERCAWAQHLEAAAARATYAQLGVHAELGGAAQGAGPRLCALCGHRMLLQRSCGACHRQFCGKCLASHNGIALCKTCAWYAEERRKCEAALSELSVPVRFRKHALQLGGLRAGASRRFVTVNAERTALVWAKTEAALATTERAIPFSEVADVLEGQQSDVFAASGRPGRDKLCFSVLCADGATLDLEAPTEDVAARWRRAIADVARFVTIVPPEEELGSSERDQEASARAAERAQAEQRAAQQGHREQRQQRLQEELAAAHSPALRGILEKQDLAAPLLAPGPSSSSSSDGDDGDHGEERRREQAGFCEICCVLS